MRKFTLIIAALMSLIAVPAQAMEGPYTGVIHTLKGNKYSVIPMEGAEHEMSHVECIMHIRTWNELMPEIIEEKFRLSGTQGVVEAGCTSVNPEAPREPVVLPVFRKITKVGESITGYLEEFLPGLEPGHPGISYPECRLRAKVWDVKSGAHEPERDGETLIRCESPDWNSDGVSYNLNIISISNKNEVTDYNLVEYRHDDFRHGQIDAGISRGECHMRASLWESDNSGYRIEETLTRQGEYSRAHAICIPQS